MYLEGIFSVIVKSMRMFVANSTKGDMVKQPYPNRYPDPVTGGTVSWEWEILSSFLRLHSLTPAWSRADTWGWRDTHTNTWTGAVGQAS